MRRACRGSRGPPRRRARPRGTPGPAATVPRCIVGVRASGRLCRSGRPAGSARRGAGHRPAGRPRRRGSYDHTVGWANTIALPTTAVSAGVDLADGPRSWPGGARTARRRWRAPPVPWTRSTAGSPRSAAARRPCATKSMPLSPRRPNDSPSPPEPAPSHAPATPPGARTDRHRSRRAGSRSTGNHARRMLRTPTS